MNFRGNPLFQSYVEHKKQRIHLSFTSWILLYFAVLRTFATNAKVL